MGPDPRLLLRRPHNDVHRLLDCVALVNYKLVETKVVEAAVALMFRRNLLDVFWTVLILKEPKDMRLPLVSVPSVDVSDHQCYAVDRVLS